jgi:hypothetical protein
MKDDYVLWKREYLGGSTLGLFEDALTGVRKITNTLRTFGL